MLLEKETAQSSSKSCPAGLRKKRHGFSLVRRMGDGRGVAQDGGVEDRTSFFFRKSNKREYLDNPKNAGNDVRQSVMGVDCVSIVSVKYERHWVQSRKTRGG